MQQSNKSEHLQHYCSNNLYKPENTTRDSFISKRDTDTIWTIPLSQRVGLHDSSESFSSNVN